MMAFRFLLLGVLISFLLPIDAFESLTNFTERGVSHRQISCGTDPNWQDTIDAWNNANTDPNLSQWWSSVLSRPNSGFANELGKNFGSHIAGFQCGILDFSTCLAPGCSNFASDPVWSYLATEATVNLDTLMNRIYNGIEEGQTSYVSAVGDLSKIFFPWKKPEFAFGDVSIWLQAIVSTLCSMPLALTGPLGVLFTGEVRAKVRLAVGNLLDSGLNEINSQLEPIANELEVTDNLEDLSWKAANASQQGIEAWGNSTFAGLPDSQNRTIVDYLRGGSYITSDLPSSNQVQSFYTDSDREDDQLSMDMVFIMCTKTQDRNDTSGPALTKYYSEQYGGVCYLYCYHADGVLKGHLEKPWGLEYLNGTNYNIYASDATEYSVRAWLQAGFNYTSDIATSRIIDAVASNGPHTPWADGAKWEGVWTIPVCDTGDQNWNQQYGDKTSRYGSLPCCCGDQCNQTSSFIKAARMKGFQTLLRGCKSQISNTDLNFDNVDYGFEWKKSFPLFYAELSKGKKAGVTIGFILGGIMIICFINVMFLGG